MFKYKTEAELQAMTPEERDAYATEKRQHEANEAKKSAETAAKEAAKIEVETATKELKETVETQKTTIDGLKETVRVQGEKITEMNKASKEGLSGETAEASFKEAYENAQDDSGEIPIKKQIRISVKDIVSTSVMTASTVPSGTFPTAGSSGVITSGMYAMWAKFLGFFGLMSPESKIMDLVNIEPLTEGRLYAINTTTIGNAAITPECVLKPIVRQTFTDQDVKAEPVAAMWFTDTFLRKFYNRIASLFRQTFAQLINREVPQHVLTVIRNNSSAFTPNPLFNIDENPNNYDALGAVIASIQNLGYLPNAILIHPTAFRNMKQSKTNDGVYNLSNGNSISIVGNGSGLDWNGVAIPIILDATLEDDEFIVGDLNTAVRVGLDNELLYMETDGRVDSNEISVTGLAKNIRTHVLERFVAVLIPESLEPLIIRDTFSNVKTLIAQAAPSV